MSEAVIYFSYFVTLVFIVCVDCDVPDIKISHPDERSRVEVPRPHENHKINDLLSKPVHSSLNLSQQTVFQYDSQLNNSFNNVSLDQEIHKTTRPNTVINDISTFALEGGGTGFPTQNSSNISLQDSINVSGGEFHSKGSKGRKGVKFPGSSVVPRKGVPAAVDQLGETQLNNSVYTNTTEISRPMDQLPVNGRGNTTTDIKEPLSETTKPQVKVETQEKTNKPNVTHKKPEYVSDEKDVDDFNSYSIIKVSTTGEDYVIISIVVVVGIWFSVFGALIFYRRAGEYWDRRHYRRMDFLVEGMYNE